MKGLLEFRFEKSDDLLLDQKKKEILERLKSLSNIYFFDLKVKGLSFF